MKKLILFDIDGTLLIGTKTHTDAMEKALKEVFNVDSAILINEVSGKTDKQIVTESLMKAGYNKEEIDKRFGELVANMVESFNKSDLPDMSILPGVKALLEKLSKRKGLILGLLTGNPKELADIKPNKFGIKKYFVFGAYGHEHTDRAELVRDAVSRARKEMDIDGVVIIGDTYRDVIAAKKNNVKVIAVASGHSSFDELKKHKPDHLFRDLVDNDKVIEAIIN